MSKQHIYGVLSTDNLATLRYKCMLSRLSDARNKSREGVLQSLQNLINMGAFKK